MINRSVTLEEARILMRLGALVAAIYIERDGPGWLQGQLDARTTEPTEEFLLQLRAEAVRDGFPENRLLAADWAMRQNFPPFL